MLRSPAAKKILLIWLAWWVGLFAFQGFAVTRLQPARPDTALQWTRTETGKNSQNDKPYLLEPFLNEHVSWDSEFYLGIADTGYDNPNIRSIPGTNGEKVSLSYAFFPLYPFVMRLVAAPLGALGMGRLAAVTLAGVIVALLGTLAAMFALYDLARGWLGEAGGLRAAYYLLIFPTSFFLAQVYTEGLFIGLAFGALAFMRRRKLWAAALLAALAVWTRPVGVGLVFPLGLAAWEMLREARAQALPRRQAYLAAVFSLAPLVSLGIWWLSKLRPAFQYVEDQFFGRYFLIMGQSWGAWTYAWDQLTTSGNGPTQMYFALEFALVFIGLITSLALLRRQPGVALFSLAVFAISFFSGSAQSMSRYIITMPAMFLSLAWVGKQDVFDRGWTIASVLWMGMLAALFSWDMWVG